MKRKASSLLIMHSRPNPENKIGRRRSQRFPARRVIDDVIADASAKDLQSELLTALNLLQLENHNPDGEFTNGKGVLGSLIGDISSALSGET